MNPTLTCCDAVRLEGAQRLTFLPDLFGGDFKVSEIKLKIHFPFDLNEATFSRMHDLNVDDLRVDQPRGTDDLFHDLSAVLNLPLARGGGQEARLPGALDRTVDADGGHASRSPEAGLELLLDLLTLDDALSQLSQAGPDAIRAAIQRMLASKEVYVLDVMTPYTEHVLPMIPSGKTYKDIITE